MKNEITGDAHRVSFPGYETGLSAISDCVSFFDRRRRGKLLVRDRGFAGKSYPLASRPLVFADRAKGGCNFTRRLSGLAAGAPAEVKLSLRSDRKLHISDRTRLRFVRRCGIKSTSVS